MKKSKTLICTLLTVLLLICAFTGCAKTENEENNETSSTATTASSVQTTATQAYDNGYDDAQEQEPQYYHSAIQGCVIENQDGSAMFSYKEKCEACGYVSSSSHMINHTFGTYTSSFLCPKCNNVQSVEIESNEN